MKTYKINVTPYTYEVMKRDADSQEDREARTMHVKFMLPRILCNGNLGKGPDGKVQKEDKSFDLLTVGPLAQEIEQCKETHLKVSGEAMKMLKERVTFVSKFFDYVYVEMFRRIMDAKEISALDEAEKKPEESK